MEPFYIVIAVLLILLIVGGIALAVRTHARRTKLDISAAPSAPSRAEANEVASAKADTNPSTLATVESPESVSGRMQRLRSRLAGSGSFGKALLGVLARGDLSAADWEEIEETLITADLGIDVATTLLEKLRTQVKVLDTTDPGAVRQVLRQELLQLVDPHMDRQLNLTKPTPAPGFSDGNPAAAILMVGVNGTGKTTTCAKLARLLVAEDKTVVMGAADTFRAAAADQLATWGKRVGVEVVRSDKEGADPASVAFDAAKFAATQEADVVLVDTAGRLQNKTGLMDELGKIKRVMNKIAPVGEILLVLDATTGQNGLRQAQVFAQAVGITGIVLTKLDGSAKGGIVVTVQRELAVPVKFVGLGEGADDLAPFDPENFVDALLA